MAWVEDWFVARVFTYSRKATRFSSLWATVDHCGPLWATVGHYGPLWTMIFSCHLILRNHGLKERPKVGRAKGHRNLHSPSHYSAR